MIRRDRNHPSIILWETSLNESSYTTAWATSIQAVAHAEFPGNQMFTSGWRTTVFDTYCSSEQANARTSGDSRPIIIDEYGDWNYGGNSSTSRVARESADTNLLVQCDNFENSYSLDGGVSWFSADALWDFADYTGYLTSTTKCGVMDTYRLPKFSYYFYQSQRDPALSIPNVVTGPMVYIANTWQTNSPTTIRVFSNCQKVSLYTNGILFATQSPDVNVNYPNVPHPPFTFNLGSYINGTIRADGLTNSVVACSTTRRTPGVASQIILQAEGNDLLSADGGDARLVFVSVTDANNQVVPNATNAVYLSVTGHGHILGPASINLKGGQLATWIQSSRTVGTMTLTASGSGLSPASLTLTNQPVPYVDPIPTPAAPTGLTVTPGNSLLALNWNPTAFAFSYTAKRATNSGGSYSLIASNLLTTSFTDSNLASAASYYYVVSAVNEAGVQGSNSVEAAAIATALQTNLINGGFETNTSGTIFNTKVTTGYDVSGNNVAGWLNAGATYADSGVDYAGHAGIVVHGGSVTAYCDQGDSGAYQIVAYPMNAGDKLTLTWWAKSSYNNSHQSVSLWSAASTASAYNSLTLLTNSTAALNQTGNGGAYTQYTLNYIAVAGDAGKYIAVSFYCPGTAGSYAMFDDFNLAILSLPVAPSGLTAVAGDGQVVLNWNAVANATSYNLKQSLVSGGSYTVTATNLASLTFTNSELTNGTTYYYVVSAVNAAGEGTNSAEVSATPLPPIPAVPAGLAAQAGNGHVSLHWNTAANAAGYAIYRSTFSGGFDTFVASVTTTNYNDVTAIPGATYYYSLTATNLAGASDFSGQASVTPLPISIGGLSLAGTNLMANGSNGMAGMNYLLLMTTNLSLPMTNWQVIATNHFDGNGNFNFTNEIPPAAPQNFYLLQLP
jgi:fibronectin type 3 domain-containing protein